MNEDAGKAVRELQKAIAELKSVVKGTSRKETGYYIARLCIYSALNYIPLVETK